MRVAHVSDWHTTPLEGAGVAPFLSQRVLGLISWKLRRRATHRSEVLSALFDDLRSHAPDHIAITGDLTNVALPQEFVGAKGLLAELAEPESQSDAT